MLNRGTEPLRIFRQRLESDDLPLPSHTLGQSKRCKADVSAHVIHHRTAYNMILDRSFQVGLSSSQEIAEIFGGRKANPVT